MDETGQNVTQWPRFNSDDPTPDVCIVCMLRWLVCYHISNSAKDIS